MSVILGIDIGGSTTKIVGLRRDGSTIAMHRVQAQDPITSLYGALGNFLFTNGLALSDVSRIVLTGVGASYVEGDIYGIPTEKVEEFTAVGVGGATLCFFSVFLCITPIWPVLNFAKNGFPYKMGFPVTGTLPVPFFIATVNPELLVFTLNLLKAVLVEVEIIVPLNVLIVDFFVFKVFSTSESLIKYSSLTFLFKLVFAFPIE